MKPEERFNEFINTLEIFKTTICVNYRKASVETKAIKLDQVMRWLKKLIQAVIMDFEQDESKVREIILKIVEVKKEIYKCLGVNENVVESSVIPARRQRLLEAYNELKKLKQEKEILEQKLKELKLV